MEKLIDSDSMKQLLSIILHFPLQPPHLHQKKKEKEKLIQNQTRLLLGSVHGSSRLNRAKKKNLLLLYILVD